MTLQLRFSNRFVLEVLGNCLISGLWIIAAMYSPTLLGENVSLIIAQLLLTFLALRIFFKTLPRAHSTTGPTLISILAIHVLLYYSISNIIPSLFPERSIFLLLNRIHWSPPGTYFAGSIAAILFLLGTLLGSHIASIFVPNPKHHRRAPRIAKRYTWLPDYHISLIVSKILLLIVVTGTFVYGLRVGLLLTTEEVANFTFFQQLFYHGLSLFLPLAPFLAACAQVQARNIRQKRRAKRFLIVSVLLTITMLLLWRQRSTAMLAFQLPLLLFVYTGRIMWKRAIVLLLVLSTLVYATVTKYRLSEQPYLVGTSKLWSVDVSNIIHTIVTNPIDVTVLNSIAKDASYRTAGLEAVASIHEAQIHGIEPKGGVVILSGFLQALPASLRPNFYMPERIKTAPSYYGIFREGDWVTTMLAELILDFGYVWLFFPAIFIGLLYGLIDRFLLKMGSISYLSGFLIIRYAWFIYLITNGGGTGDLTLNFFKATFGYTALLLCLGFLAYGGKQNHVLFNTSRIKRDGIR